MPRLAPDSHLTHYGAGPHLSQDISEPLYCPAAPGGCVLHPQLGESGT